LTEGLNCATCGKQHQGLPRSFAADFPDMYANMTREERDARTIIGSDQCVVDQQWFFIRGCLEIPVAGSSEPFLWGLWASVLEPAFDEISETWEKNGREEVHGPFKGRLANSLSVYAGTLNVKVSIAIQPVGTRPLRSSNAMAFTKTGLRSWHRCCCIRNGSAGLRNLRSIQPIIYEFHTFPTGARVRITFRSSFQASQ
jgi:hypothetical protein